VTPTLYQLRSAGWHPRGHGGQFDSALHLRLSNLITFQLGYHFLAGTRGQDWGVCANPRSHRSGLLLLSIGACSVSSATCAFSALNY